MVVSFHDIVLVHIYEKRDYRDIIGDPTNYDWENPCYLTLAMSRTSRLLQFYKRHVLKKYFNAWCQLKTNTMIEQDDCCD